MRKVGIYFHSRSEAARELAHELCDLIRPSLEAVWVCSAWDDEATSRNIDGTDMIISVGGDGTVLRAARAVVPHPVLILGVNMGRLGFLAELTPAEAREKLPYILHGGGRVEMRTMLKAELLAPLNAPPISNWEYHALNDVVAARSSVGRPVYVSVSIDSVPLATYRADAVIIATATGSTGYSLSAGGPVLYPETQALVLTPVAPHLSAGTPLVLPASALVEMRVEAEHPAILSVDGQEEIEMVSGAGVRVSASPHVARFLRLGPPSSFYASLARRLGWIREDGSMPPESDPPQKPV